MKKELLASLITAMFLILRPALALAEDGTNQALIERIAALESKVQVLTDKLKVYEKNEAVSVPDEVIQKKVDDILADRGGFGNGFLKALDGISLSGFVDTTYMYNFNDPENGLNTARVFDTESNSFALQAAKIAFEKLPEAGGGVGFRTDLLFGQDAEIITPFGSNRDQFDLEQAYVDILTPWGKGFNVKAGKFVTLLGAEVIEAKDNWNISRSLLFGYAIPFTHTGIRTSYPFSDKLTGILGVNNGWDNIKDNNKSKSVETGLLWAPKDWLSFSLADIYGPEQTGNNHSNRNVSDLVVTFKPFEKLTLKLNTDYGYEEDALAIDKKGYWTGVAGYVRIEINKWLSLSNRTEYFNDPKGLRVVSGTGQSLWENTSTLELRPFKNLITRLEYRFDESSQDIFTKHEKVADHQSTIGVQAIYIF